MSFFRPTILWPATPGIIHIILFWMLIMKVLREEWMCHHFNLFSATWDSSEWQMAAAATTLQVVLVFEQFSFTEFPKMWIYRLFPMSDQISYPPPVRMWINRYIDFFPCQMSYHPPCQALHCTEEGCRPFRLSYREGAGRYLGWCIWCLWRHIWDDVLCIHYVLCFGGRGERKSISVQRRQIPLLIPTESHPCDTTSATGLSLFSHACK